MCWYRQPPPSPGFFFPSFPQVPFPVPAYPPQPPLPGAQLANRVTALESSVAALETEVNLLHQKIAELERRVRRLERDGE